MNKQDNEQPITILQVIGTLDRGGAETFLMNVLRNIDRERFHFVFLCFGDDIKAQCMAVIRRYRWSILLNSRLNYKARVRGVFSILSAETFIMILSKRSKTIRQML